MLISSIHLSDSEYRTTLKIAKAIENNYNKRYDIIDSVLTTIYDNI